MANQASHEAPPRKPLVTQAPQDPNYHYVQIEKLGGQMEEFMGQYEAVIHETGAELVKGEERKRRQLYRYPKEVYEARQKAIEDEAQRRVLRKAPGDPRMTDQIKLGEPLNKEQLFKLNEQLKELQAQEATPAVPNG
jgi:hypothetical protein